MKEKIPHIFFHLKNLHVVLKEVNSSNSRLERFASDVSSACLWISLNKGGLATLTLLSPLLSPSSSWKIDIMENSGFCEKYTILRKPQHNPKLIKKTATHSKLIKRIQHFIQKP